MGMEPFLSGRKGGAETQLSRMKVRDRGIKVPAEWHTEAISTAADFNWNFSAVQSGASSRY